MKQPGVRALPIGVYSYPPPEIPGGQLKAVQLTGPNSLNDPVIRAFEQTTRLNDWINRRAQSIIDAIL